MKKLFISCPMKGRTEEQIRDSRNKMHKIAEAVFGEELEVIDSYIKNDPPATNSIAIWMLGESIKKMASADYYIGTDIYDVRAKMHNYPGCIIENRVADSYKIERHYLKPSLVAPDILEDEDE